MSYSFSVWYHLRVNYFYKWWNFNYSWARNWLKAFTQSSRFEWSHVTMACVLLGVAENINIQYLIRQKLRTFSCIFQCFRSIYLRMSLFVLVNRKQTKVNSCESDAYEPKHNNLMHQEKTMLKNCQRIVVIWYWL